MNTYENRQCASITTAACRTSENCRNKLTADRSTTELRWIALGDAEHTVASPFVQGKRCFGTKEKLLTQHSSKKLVAGAGFEPAVPQARDYEPGRGRPIVLQNPSPPFEQEFKFPSIGENHLFALPYQCPGSLASSSFGLTRIVLIDSVMGIIR